MIACTRVRIAYAKVASISTATSPAVTARLTSSGPQLMTVPPDIRSWNASTDTRYSRGSPRPLSASRACS